ncbi:MAG: hypothetical protein LBT15_07715 [Synergistaceae bacterium]|nr:hypothetical protein [Synergistaceae bacterium]
MALAFCPTVFTVSGAEAAMPKKGDIAVVAVPMNPVSREYVDIVENAVIEKLISSGYRAVNESKKQQIHKAAAQRRADQAYLDGDVSALMKICFSYGAAMVITVKFRVDRPVENEFRLMTGTASATFNAQSSGGDFKDASPGPIMAKQVGYSEDEAKTKAIAYAATQVAEKLVR